MVQGRAAADLSELHLEDSGFRIKLEGTGQSFMAAEVEYVQATLAHVQGSVLQL